MARSIGLILLAVGLILVMLSQSVQGQETVSSLLREGAALYQKGRYDEAIAKFNRAVKLEPNNADAHAWLGRTYLQKALLEFKIVARLAPNSENGATARKWIERIQGTGTSSGTASTQQPRPTTPRVTSLAELPTVLGGRPSFETVTLFGQVYERGIVFWNSGDGMRFVYNLNRQYHRFEAVVGVGDNQNAKMWAVAKVVGDGQALFESQQLRPGEPPVKISVSVRGVLRLELITVFPPLGMNVVWADPKLIRE